MDGARVPEWAGSFGRLMAKMKPQDARELLPEDGLVAPQLRLQELTRLQCGRFPWGWLPAHVQTPFHPCRDEKCHKGLVKMCVWGQPCRACPPGTPQDWQVSPSSVRIFLSELAVHVLQECHGESLGPSHGPEVGCMVSSGLFQKARDPTSGPMAKSAGPIRGRCTLYSGVSCAEGTGSGSHTQQRLTPSSCGPLVKSSRSKGLGQACITIPFSVSDFIKNPLTESSYFFSKDEGVVTIRFSLVDAKKDKCGTAEGRGSISLGDGSLSAAGTGGPCVIAKGRIRLSRSAMAMPEGKGAPIYIKEPIFHGKGLLFNDVRGKGSVSNSIDPAKGQRLLCRSCGHGTPARSPLPASYIIFLLANGEGSITFPSSLTDIIKGKDPFAHFTEGRGKEGVSNGFATTGYQPLPRADPGGPIANEEGSITFPFVFTEDVQDKDAFMETTRGKGKATTGPAALPETRAGGPNASDEGPIVSSISTEDVKDEDAFTDSPEGKGGEDGGYGPVGTGWDPVLETSAGGSIAVSKGSITIPFSVFSFIKHEGPGYRTSGPKGSGPDAHGCHKKRRLRSRFGKSSSGSQRDGGVCRAGTCCGPCAERDEDFWIWVSLTICALWLLCMCKLSPGLF
ncbi:receptor-transporting protein 5 [Choloepus didactylus]|uniref:receptor-transporting protein 5 n=1 Tax=Choloepus didactylus TaxID=27675 RepID=UPI00189FEA3A|nr:receptor-transporting protein 5 [Choloepus didactylus]